MDADNVGFWDITSAYYKIKIILSPGGITKTKNFVLRGRWVRMILEHSVFLESQISCYLGNP